MQISQGTDARTVPGCTYATESVKKLNTHHSSKHDVQKERKILRAWPQFQPRIHRLSTLPPPPFPVNEDDRAGFTCLRWERGLSGFQVLPNPHARAMQDAIPVTPVSASFTFYGVASLGLPQLLSDPPQLRQSMHYQLP